MSHELAADDSIQPAEGGPLAAIHVYLCSSVAKQKSMVRVIRVLFLCLICVFVAGRM
jgi:hypothetical protein